MDAKKNNLGELLRKIKCGEIQLPDFQRDWVWSDEKIKSLIESVIRNFPINSILLLECEANDIKFSCHTIAGVGEIDSKPHLLILDGQQRLTSLYGAFSSDKPVKLANDKEFFYYVDMRKAIAAVKTAANFDDIIISVPTNRKLKTKRKISLDLSTPDKEFAAGMFPLNKIFESRQWLRAYEKHFHEEIAEKFADDFCEEIIDKVAAYEIVCIQLEKNTPLGAVCKIFEKVNDGVAKLGTFDLLTAILAANKTSDGKNVSLREDLKKIQETFEESGLEVLEEVDCADFITALTLLVTYKNFCDDKKNRVSCKSEDTLKLKLDDYLRYRNDLVKGFIEAAKFLEAEGIRTKKYLPYAPQLIPMAAIFAELNFLDKNNAASLNKIRRWYWCGVFSEAYRDGHLNRFAKDLVQVIKWIKSDKTPEIIENVRLGAWKLIKVKSLQSAIYKGLVSIIFKNGATDFIAGKNIADYADSLEVHHIFPKKYCAIKKLPKEKFDCIINKTLILRNTNKVIGDNPPSVYLETIENKTGLAGAEVDEILKAHFIDPALCRADDFHAFLADRAKEIFGAVEQLTKRKISDREEVEKFLADK